MTPMIEERKQGAHGAYDDGSWLVLGHYCTACGCWISKQARGEHKTVDLSPRLWIYTNYDCNLACAYCLASSSPLAERRAMPLTQYSRLLGEAQQLGIDELFLTGGEPFLLPHIFEMIALGTRSFQTTVLSNAMLIKGRRLEQLRAVSHSRLAVQVSLDDDQPGLHDAYRGEGAWEQAVSGIRALQSIGVRVRIATTVTAALEPRLDDVREFVRESLGIPETDHVIRPVLKRGFADEGLEVHKRTLTPELTVDSRGVYWHPAGTDADLLVTTDTGSLRLALEEVARVLAARAGIDEIQPFR
jgi:MoaA/NifB/PqqE/SkfB family radical SAM enzyme